MSRPICLGKGTKESPHYYVMDQRVTDAIRNGKWDTIMLENAANELDRLRSAEQDYAKLLALIGATNIVSACDEIRLLRLSRK